MTKEMKAMTLEQLAVISDAADAIKHSNYIRAREIKIAVESVIDTIKSIKIEENDGNSFWYNNS